MVLPCDLSCLCRSLAETDHAPETIAKYVHNSEDMITKDRLEFYQSILFRLKLNADCSTMVRHFGSHGIPISKLDHQPNDHLSSH